MHEHACALCEVRYRCSGFADRPEECEDGCRGCGNLRELELED